MGWGRTARCVVVLGVFTALLAEALPAGAASSSPPGRRATGDAADGFGIQADRKALGQGHTASGGLPIRTTRPLSPCPTAWRVFPNTPNGTWNNLIGNMTAISATDIWAVGSAEMPVPPPTGDGDMTLAEHWDGSTWALSNTPNPGQYGDDLNDVAFVASSNVWAVGLKFASATPSALAMQWSGSFWTETSPSLPPDSGDGLNGVAAVSTNDVWAVGFYVADNGFGTLTQHTLILHWNAGWSVVSSPNVGTGNNQLYTVTAISATDVWAVGFSRATPGSPRSSLIEHWNGTTWSVVSSPNIANDTLVDAAFDASNSGYAVGYYTGSNGAQQPVIARWNGTVWTDVTGYSVPSVYGEYLASITVVSSTEYWAVGSYINSSTNINGPLYPFAMEGSATGGWAMTGPPMGAAGSRSNTALAVAAPVSGDVWAAGYALGLPNIWRTLIQNLTGLGAPGITSVTPGDGQVTVNWTAPCPGPSAITSYVVTASDGCTVQSSQTVSGSPPATTLAYTGLDNGSPLSFTVAAVNGQGTGMPSAPSSTVIPTGSGKPDLISACSAQQYSLPPNNGATWTAMDTTNLAVSFTPAADSYAVMTGNADLWTPKAGYNQDLGIAVTGGAYPTTSGQPEAWKESGGVVATYSPNAALVQTVVPVSGGTTYTAQLVWKPNHSDPYSIFAGAGPVPAGSSTYSPTRITVQLVPVASASVFKAISTQQYRLTGNNGQTWAAMDPTNLKVSFSVPASGYDTVFLAANADLWTNRAGFNQDFGIAMTGGAYPSTAGQPETWKESGSAKAAYSPNAAYVVAGEPVAASTSYTATMVWKVNQPDPYSIFSGAGPVPSGTTKYSPTTLVAILVPSAPPGSRANWSGLQFSQQNSDGNTWVPVGLPIMTPWVVFTPSSSGDFIFVVDVDLWTMVNGYNQDAALFITGGAFGAGGTLPAWKESGGLAGTFSPNAAALLVPLHLDSGVTYIFTMVWKTNGLSKVFTDIRAGAGPINTSYSPTWLTAVPV